ncbi:MAG: hypothetical protein E6Q98_09785 [Rhodospirillaceae bacterium]|nr:MAG: hypothetical protein E6Q98_09785 [Rhodospirillaceae bacterium]
MTSHVLVISHADADGHLIAEQTRRNLDLVKNFDVQVIVDPMRTQNHKVWHRLDSFTQIDDADLVFFVDLMFAPESCAAEAEALVEFVNARPEKKFFLIDHHPLPLRRLEQAENLRVSYRPDVFECAIGPRSGMMVIAALCEKQDDRVSGVTSKQHEILALGMKRAAALGGPLPGEKLLALLKNEFWPELAELGAADRASHRLPRGRWPVAQQPSDPLRRLDDAAIALLAGKVPNETLRREAVAYDLDVTQERFAHDAPQPMRLPNSTVSSKDLEAIITLLEVAALSLTTAPGDVFTLEELIQEANEMSGNRIQIEERDVLIVLGKTGFLKKVRGGYCMK